MTVIQDLCNATTKKGSKHLICERDLGHPPPHRDHDVEWTDSGW